MTINAVEQYVVGILTNFTSPSETEPITVLHVPPTIETLSGAGTYVYVWDSKTTEKRMTAPRFSLNSTGKTIEHDLIVHLINVYTNDFTNELVQQGFAVTLDSVTDILRGKNANITVTLPITITDPLTNEESYIISIGEDISIEQDYPQLNDLGYYLRQAMITFNTTEQVSG